MLLSTAGGDATGAFRWTWWITTTTVTTTVTTTTTWRDPRAIVLRWITPSVRICGRT